MMKSDKNIFKIEFEQPLKVGDSEFSEVNVDFSLYTADDYIRCLKEGVKSGDAPLSYFGLAPFAKKQLVSLLFDCMPEELDGMPIRQYVDVENMVSSYFVNERLSSKPPFDADFTKVTVRKYLSIQSANYFNSDRTLGAGVDARLQLISVATGKDEDTLKKLKLNDYYLLDLEACSFFGV